MRDQLYTYKVIGTVLTEHISYMPSRLTEYELFVAFSSWKDHEQVLRDYLRWYCSCDLERYPEDCYQVLNDWNCAQALATYHMRKRYVRLETKSADVVPDTTRPSTPPEVDAPTVKIWVVEKTQKDVNRPANAAWELRMACRYGKLSVEEAKSLVWEKFPDDHFSWHDVLRAFSKEGGRYTAKYLRMEP